MFQQVIVEVNLIHMVQMETVTLVCVILLVSCLSDIPAVGGLVFGNSFGQEFQYHEWTSFISDTQFCFRACVRVDTHPRPPESLTARIFRLVQMLHRTANTSYVLGPCMICTDFTYLHISTTQWVASGYCFLRFDFDGTDTLLDLEHAYALPIDCILILPTLPILQLPIMIRASSSPAMEMTSELYLPYLHHNCIRCACLHGTSSLPMGVYGTSTWFQGVSPTPSAHPIASSSNCRTVPTVTASPAMKKRDGLVKRYIPNSPTPL
jgi:hypothetical protein